MFAFSAALLLGDVYLHNPRGSNNKLNEQNNNVQNNNRLFDSQNNNAGGYQIGDNCDPVCQGAGGLNPGSTEYNRSLPGAAQGQMYYYEGSVLELEWTNQHGCGSKQGNVECEIVIQYMCNDGAGPYSSPTLRDGLEFSRVDGTAGGPQGQAPSAEHASESQRGLHESLAWYEDCKARERNKGLYIADQNLGGGRDRATNTRQDRGAPAQNNDNDREGLECPEERDYFPYWHPTPWRDIAVLTDDLRRCDFYQAASQNVRDYGNCCDPAMLAESGHCRQLQAADEAGPNNEAACVERGGKWREYGRWDTKPPRCGQTPFSRDNHLGNAAPSAPGTPDADLAASRFVWSIPDDVLDETGADEATCVLRLRYNVSTTDYDGWAGFDGRKTSRTPVDSVFNGGDALISENEEADFVGFSPMEDPPLGTDLRLELNVNTDQLGRTFQDRSHTFKIKRRPSSGPCASRSSGIYNLNVRGRRGNIVQVYPSVEYDFVPANLEVSEGECVHFQWTGSDANQGGNDGNGRDKTDRSNLVEVASLGDSRPARQAFASGEPAVASMFVERQAVAWWTHRSDEETVRRMAYLDQEWNYSMAGARTPSLICDDETNNENDVRGCKYINAAPAYFDGGLVQMNRPGTFHYISTRNNDFSNRSQKATLVVRGWRLTLVVAVGVVLAVACLSGVCLLRRHARHHPDGRLARSRLGALLVRCPSLTAMVQRSLACRYPATTALLCLCAALWGVGFRLALERTDAPPSYPYAKGFGMVLNVLCNLVFVPVMRNLISWLRTTSAAAFLPVDDTAYFHKLIGALILSAAAGHIACHYSAYSWRATYGAGGSVAGQALGRWDGLSGHLIALFMLLMSLTGLERFRRARFGLPGRRGKVGGYSIFSHVHKLWVLVLALLWFHSRTFWKFSLFPTLLLVLDKCIALRAKKPVVLVRAHSPTKDVLALTLRLSSGRRFKFKAGQYVFLQCGEVSSEWHPFSVSSSAEDNHTFSLHIRCRADMDWTFALSQALLQQDLVTVAPAMSDVEGGPRPSIHTKRLMSLSDDDLTRAVEAGPAIPAPLGGVPVGRSRGPSLCVDGPYGSSSEEVFHYEILLLVAAGIGVTPFASILKTLARQAQTDRLETPLKRCSFFWICRDEREFQSFKDVLVDILADTALANIFELNTYITGEVDLKAVTADASYNQFAGKPDWGRIGRALGESFPASDVGVFVCGPSALSNQLSAMCRTLNPPRRRERRNYGAAADEKSVYAEPRKGNFVFHKEYF